MLELTTNSIGLTCIRQTEKRNIKAIKYNGNKKDGYSVLLSVNGFNIWMDTSSDSDGYFMDWNMYIFYLYNDLDSAIKEIQEDPINYEICSYIAMEFLEDNNLI